jgi:hypothetical protein
MPTSDTNPAEEQDEAWHQQTLYKLFAFTFTSAKDMENAVPLGSPGGISTSAAGLPSPHTFASGNIMSRLSVDMPVPANVKVPFILIKSENC